MKKPRVYINDDRTLLLEASRLTQDIGRKIGSPFNDRNDLTDLTHALAHISETLQTIRDTVDNRT
jgi:hypothetical protein